MTVRPRHGEPCGEVAPQPREAGRRPLLGAGLIESGPQFRDSGTMDGEVNMPDLESAQEVLPGIRKHTLRKFPFSLIYSIEGELWAFAPAST